MRCSFLLLWKGVHGLKTIMMLLGPGQSDTFGLQLSCMYNCVSFFPLANYLLMYYFLKYTIVHVTA